MLRGLTLNGCYRMGLIKQVQRGTITITGGSSSGTSSINAVVMENTIVHFTGVVTEAGSGSDVAGTVNCRLELASTTSVSATFHGGDAQNASTTIAFEVIEFYPGVVRVQRGTISGTTTTTGIKAVVIGKTFINYLWHTYVATTGNTWGTPNLFTSYISLTATTIAQQQSSSGVVTHVSGFEVVEILMHGLDI